MSELDIISCEFSEKFGLQPHYADEAARIYATSKVCVTYNEVVNELHKSYGDIIFAD